MEREDDIIELAVASTETLGVGELPTDEIRGNPLSGLSDD